MTISIVIPVYNQLQMTHQCLTSLIQSHSMEYEIIVVDDGSKQPIHLLSKTFPQIKMLRNETNLGFAQAVNKGIAEAKGDLVILLNNDTIINSPSWLKTITESMKKYHLDMTAPAGGRMTYDFRYLNGEATRYKDEFAYLVGWCLAIKPAVFEKIGLIPTDFGTGFWEDVLFSLRAKKAGFRLGITEGTDVQHLYHQTFKAEGYDIKKEYEAKRRIFLRIAHKENLTI